MESISAYFFLDEISFDLLCLFVELPGQIPSRWPETLLFSDKGVFTLPEMESHSPTSNSPDRLGYDRII